MVWVVSDPVPTPGHLASPPPGLAGMVGARRLLPGLLRLQGTRWEFSQCSDHCIHVLNHHYSTARYHSTLKREVDGGVGLWGACFDGGQPHEGAGEAPGLLRAAGLVERLRGEGGLPANCCLG